MFNDEFNNKNGEGSDFELFQAADVFAKNAEMRVARSCFAEDPRDVLGERDLEQRNDEMVAFLASDRRKSLPHNDLGALGAAPIDVSPYTATTYDD